MQDQPATTKPKRAAQVQVARTQTEVGKAAYVLHNPDAHTYLKIDEQNYFLWELMDGDHEVAALAIAYMRQYGTLPPGVDFAAEGVGDVGLADEVFKHGRSARPAPRL